MLRKKYIVCYIYAIILASVAQSDCTAGSVRLLNGSTNNEGRLEVCVNNEWGTVCATSWDRRKTTNVCKQLGYSEIGIAQLV